MVNVLFSLIGLEGIIKTEETESLNKVMTKNNTGEYQCSKATLAFTYVLTERAKEHLQSLG